MNPSQSFQSILWQYAIKQGINPDYTVVDSLGVAGGLSAANVAAWSEHLSEGAEQIWYPDKRNPEIAWPDTVNTATLTPAGNLISFAQIGLGNFARFWSQDPQPLPSPPVAYPIPAVKTVEGFRLRSALTSVFAFFRPLRPKFTYVPFVAIQVYPVGSVVYDPQQILSGTTHASTTIDGIASTTGLIVGQPVVGTGIPANTTIATIASSTSVTINNAATSSTTNLFTFGSGNCFLCATSSAGNTITNASNWTPQLVPDSLVKVLIPYAYAMQIKAAGNDPKNHLAEFSALLTQEMERSLPQGGPAPPWHSDYSA